MPNTFLFSELSEDTQNIVIQAEMWDDFGNNLIDVIYNEADQALTEFCQILEIKSNSLQINSNMQSIRIDNENILTKKYLREVIKDYRKTEDTYLNKLIYFIEYIIDEHYYSAVEAVEYCIESYEEYITNILERTEHKLYLELLESKNKYDINGNIVYFNNVIF